MAQSISWQMLVKNVVNKIQIYKTFCFFRQVSHVEWAMHFLLYRSIYDLVSLLYNVPMYERSEVYFVANYRHLNI